MGYVVVNGMSCYKSTWNQFRIDIRSRLIWFLLTFLLYKRLSTHVLRLTFIYLYAEDAKGGLFNASRFPKM
jgi:hypothetical protein